MSMRNPNFFIVGAAKSGTTSFWAYLKDNPEVFMAGDELIKEPCFFSDYHGGLTLDSYLELFDGAKETQKMLGDTSTIYLSDPTSAGRIYDFDKDAKIIIILRNPVERAWSLYNWMVQEGYEFSSTFEDALELEDFRVNKKMPNFFEPAIFYWDYMYYRSGLYFEQVKRYTDLFEDNVLVLKFDDFKVKPQETYGQVCNFINVESNRISKESHNVSQAVFYPKLQFLLRYIANYTTILFSLVVRGKIKNNFIGNFLLKIGVKNSKPASMSKETREKLRLQYKEDVEKLEILTGILFNEWKRDTE